MSSYLRVTPEELGAKATQIESCVENYRTCYEKIQAEAETLSIDWRGPASEAFLSRVRSFDNDFKSLNNLLLTYVDFLRTTEANYQSNENDVIQIMSTLTVGR